MRNQHPDSLTADSKPIESNESRPLPTFIDPSYLDDEGQLSAATLTEMVAVQRGLIESMQNCTGEQCAELVAHTRTLALLTKELAKRNPAIPGVGYRDALARAHELADIFPGDIKMSHRADRVGPTVTAVKKALVTGLRPFHIETLRPQYHFNLALLDTLKQVLGQKTASIRPDLQSWVRTRLEPIANPSTWRVPSHRRRPTADAIKLVKNTYLNSMRAVLEELLEGQRLWNEAAIRVVLLFAAWDAPTRAEQLEALEAMGNLCDPLGREGLSASVKNSAPIWNEVFRKQVAFNQEIHRALSNVAGVNPRRAITYRAWCEKNEHAEIEAARAAMNAFHERPRFSVIMPTYETPEAVLRAALDSVLAQMYMNWELCIADDNSKSAHVREVLNEYARKDTRIRVVRLSKQNGIAGATNAALEMATGDFVAFLDHDDLLAPHALAEMAAKINADPQVDLLYSDEDRLDTQGRRSGPFFKPGWSPDLLRASNYICHLLVIRRAVVQSVNGLRLGLDGAQDYDLILRVTEKTSRIAHVPRVLYHWRASAQSTALDPNNKPAASSAGVRALAEHLDRCGESAKVDDPKPTSYRVRYPIKGKPLVSIIVPFKDKPELLKQLVTSLLKHTRYSNFELLLISNNSVKPETQALLDTLDEPRIRKLTWNHPFNYSAINNYGASQAKGELFLFLNNDIEVISTDWLEELISQAQRPEVGAVGPKLLFPDGTIQHAGVVLGLGGFAGHAFANLPDNSAFTPFGHADWTRNYLAVTSACVMMRRDVFEKLEGYDTKFLVCGSDVEICLRMIKSGLRVVYTPHATLVHHESATRKNDSIPENDFWRSYVAYRPWLHNGDNFYNPNLSLEVADGSLRENKISAEDVAVQTLSRELPGSRAAIASPGRAEHLKHIMPHVQTLDYESAAARKARVQFPTQAAAMQQSHRLKDVTWFVPYFNHPYGGVHTILRFGSLLQKLHGVTSRFVVYDAPHASDRELEARVATLFPTLPGTFHVLKRIEDMAKLPNTDLAIATLWTSVYFVSQFKQAGAKGYFVQDFEPLFYPAGSFYALAEQTYTLGLHGIFNTQGLHDYVTSNYPMKGVAFEPAVDRNIFHARRPEANRPVRVFFYARPSTNRNGFELGILALKKLKAEYGSGVEIVTAGEHWSPEAYGLNGEITNLGVLPYENTADLYRECDVGLCFMFTKHPSYLPLEMMACGVTVVTNNNPANLWLLEHDENCLLAEPTVTCVYEQLSRAVKDRALRNRIGASAAERMTRTTWDEQVSRIYHSLTGTMGAVTTVPAKPSTSTAANVG
jgi:O-antigen biosynthesis protein